MSLSVDIDGLGETLTNLATMPAEIESEARENLNKAARLGGRVAARNLDRKTSPYGIHAASDIIEVKVATRGLKVKVDTSGAVTINKGHNYMLTLEFGASDFDGKPPVKRLTGKEEPLDRWVKRMSPTPRTEEQRELSQEELNEEVAYLISRDIEQFGLKEKPFMRPAFGQAAAKLEKEMKTFDTSRLAL